MKWLSRLITSACAKLASSECWALGATLAEARLGTRKDFRGLGREERDVLKNFFSRLLSKGAFGWWVGWLVWSGRFFGVVRVWVGFGLLCFVG